MPENKSASGVETQQPKRMMVSYPDRPGDEPHEESPYCRGQGCIPLDSLTRHSISGPTPPRGKSSPEQFGANYPNLQAVPSDVLASRIVGQLILCKGNLVKYEVVLEKFIDKYRGEVSASALPTPPSVKQCSECGVLRDNHRYHRFRENGYAKCGQCGTSWNAAIETCPKCGDIPRFPETLPKVSASPLPAPPSKSMYVETPFTLRLNEGVWVAHALAFDLVGADLNKDQAVCDLKMCVAAQIAFAMEHGLSARQCFFPAPVEYWQPPYEFLPMPTAEELAAFKFEVASLPTESAGPHHKWKTIRTKQEGELLLRVRDLEKDVAEAYQRGWKDGSGLSDAEVSAIFAPAKKKGE